MKIWVQLVGVLFICSQMAACGGGDSKGAATSEMPAAEPVTTAASITPAQAKALADEFNEAQTLWTNTAPVNYHYTYKEGSVGYKYDAYSPVTIWVRNSKISQVISGVQVLNSDDYAYASIEQIFSRLAYTLSHSQTDTHFFVEYDALLGFPAQFKSTPSCCAQGMQLAITDLQIDP